MSMSNEPGGFQQFKEEMIARISQETGIAELVIKQALGIPLPPLGMTLTFKEILEELQVCSGSSERRYMAALGALKSAATPDECRQIHLLLWGGLRERALDKWGLLSHLEIGGARSFIEAYEATKRAPPDRLQFQDGIKRCIALAENAEEAMLVYALTLTDEKESLRGKVIRKVVEFYM